MGILKKIATYWILPVSSKLGEIREKINAFSHAKKIVVIAFFSAMAAIFQSAGIVAGFGYLISFLATAPIIMMVFFSLVHGLMGYILTVLLLLVLAPSELIVFPFTTGLLGLGLGAGMLYFKKRIAVIAFSAFWLCAGISVILYMFRFPVLGPMVETSFSIKAVAAIYVFSLFYSWFWVEISRVIIGKLIMITGTRL